MKLSLFIIEVTGGLIFTDFLTIPQAYEMFLTTDGAISLYEFLENGEVEFLSTLQYPAE